MAAQPARTPTRLCIGGMMALQRGAAKRASTTPLVVAGPGAVALRRKSTYLDLRDFIHCNDTADLADPAHAPHRPSRHGRLLRVRRTAALPAVEGLADGDRRWPAPRRRSVAPNAGRRRIQARTGAGRDPRREFPPTERLRWPRRDHYGHLCRAAVRHRLCDGHDEGCQALPASHRAASRFRRGAAPVAALQEHDSRDRAAGRRPRRRRGVCRFHRRTRWPARRRPGAGAAHPEVHLSGDRPDLLDRRRAQQAHRKDGERVRQAERHLDRL